MLSWIQERANLAAHNGRSHAHCNARPKDKEWSATAWIIAESGGCDTLVRCSARLNAIDIVRWETVVVCWCIRWWYQFVIILTHLAYLLSFGVRRSVAWRHIQQTTLLAGIGNDLKCMKKKTRDKKKCSQNLVQQLVCVWVSARSPRATKRRRDKIIYFFWLNDLFGRNGKWWWRLAIVGGCVFDKIKTNEMNLIHSHRASARIGGWLFW